MKAISVRQPWAGALALGWKPVENRSRMFSHRGEFLIHASGQLAVDFAAAERVILDTAGQAVPLLGRPNESPAWSVGAIVGVAELHAAHRGCDGSCAPGWAFPGHVHHLIRNARPLHRPVPAAGRLGVWTPDVEVLAAVEEVWPR